MTKEVKKRTIFTFAVVEIFVVVIGNIFDLEPVSIICMAIFVGSIMLIISELFSRATSALLAAALMLSVLHIVNGIPPEVVVHEYVELGTILTLFGIIIVASLGLRSGLFYYIGMKLAKMSKGNPTTLYFILAVFTYVLNIFLIAVATIVVVVFLTLAICDILKIDPRPYVLMEIFVVNVGASATMISAVPNIIIAEEASLSYSFFILYLLPFTFIFFLMSLWILYGVSPPPTVVDKMRAIAILEVDEWWFVKDKRVFYISVLCMAGIIISFMISRELMLLSLLFAVIGMMAYPKTEELIRDVDWDTLLFLVGFYIVIAGLSITGILEFIANGLIAASRGNIFLLVTLLFWISVLMSGFVDNIPYVLIIIQIIGIVLETGPYGGYSTIFWVLLILACNIGGALNPYSAPQNLMAISMCKRAKSPIITKDYYRVSVRWTITGGIMAFTYVILIMFSSRIIAKLGTYVSIFLLIASVVIILMITIQKTIGLKRMVRAIKKTPRYLRDLIRSIEKKLRTLS